MVRIYSIEANAEAQHKKCYRCNGSKRGLEIIECSNENCNKYCHVECLPDELKEEDVAELAEYFCNESCKVARQQKQQFSVAKLMAEMERMRLEHSVTAKASMEALHAMNLMKSSMAALQDENRHLRA